MSSIYYKFGVCRNCGRTRSLRPRKLCHGCYDDPAVRASHPPLDAPSNNRGHGIDPTASLAPAPRSGAPAVLVPTLAAPATRGKVAVMERRAAANLPLFHPDDCATLDGVAFADLLCLENSYNHPDHKRGRGARRTADAQGNPVCGHCGKTLSDGDLADRRKSCRGCRARWAKAYQKRYARTRGRAARAVSVR